MKKLFLLLVAFLLISPCLEAQNKSNKGKEFWVGYGHNQLNGTQRFVLYLSAEQAANVVIEIPSLGWIRNYSIPANTAISSEDIPVLAILNAEGISNNGIHVTSDVDIVAYAHQSGGSSSGATMLMPVETYGYTYYSVNYTQQTNQATAYSWFFVVASEDNTRLQITPSAATVGGRVANQMFIVTLNKGQIYNVWGQISGLTGNDMTGSKIVSVADNLGVCHPIGVFSGSSRNTICNTSSGEFMQQQIFPASAWGTRYLTYPTVSTNNTNTTNINFYRIAVRDPSTVVKRNGVVLTGLVNNFYYDIFSNVGEYIEADKPILVEQLTPSTSSPCNVSGYPSYNGLGDPEMFYLSPIEQSVKKAVFYTTNNAAITSAYVCAIMPNVSFGSFTIDGSSSFDYVGFHPQNLNYRVVIKRWPQSPAILGQQHIIESDSSFTAMVYGFGTFESYGYNAGTLINNLNALGAVQNTFGTLPSTSTCPNSPFQFSVQLAYKTSKLVWKLSQLSNLSPVSADTTLINPIPNDSNIVNGRKYYTYALPRVYSFSALGTYNVPITVTAPEIDNCSNTEDISYPIAVNQGPIANFSFVYSGCISDTAYITGLPNPNGYSISRYRWYYDDNTEDSVLNPNKKFNTQGAHPTKFRVIASNGCIGDSTKTITTTTSPTATFGMSLNQACGAATVTFTDTSAFAGTPLNVFYWNFANGNSITTNTNAPQTQGYPSWGTYIIKHFAGVTGGCRSDTAFRTLYVYANPIVNFGFTQGCLQDSTVQFSDSSTVPDNQVISWSWNFGDLSSGANNTSTLQNPTHKYIAYGTYPVTLTVTTANGCSTTFGKPYTVSGFASAIQYQIENENSLCAQSLVKLTNQATITQDSIYRIDIYWDFGNSPTVFITDNNPTQGEQYSNQYPTFTTPLTKTVTIKWVVYSKGGCVSEKLKTITLNATPAVSFTSFLQGKCVNASISSVANGVVTNGVTGGSFSYSGAGTNVLGNFNPAIAGVGVHPIKYVYTSSFGCKDSTISSIQVFPKPNSKFGYQRDVCLGDSIRFKDSATISSGKIIGWNWDFGDATNTLRLDSNAFFKTYATATSYTVKLAVTSDSLCISDTFPVMVTVRQKPISTLAVSNRLCADTLVTFTPTSSFGSGTIQTWYYNFANTQIITRNNANPVTTTYLTPGNYTVKHLVNAGPGCNSDTTDLPITIYANPVTNFNMSSGCLPDSTASFTDITTTSDGQMFNWNWNFGDPSSGVNNVSVIQNPTHKYLQYSSYPVTLRTTTTNGCSSTRTKNFAVFGYVPNVVYSIANQLQLCSNKSVTITHQTPITVDSIYKLELYWDFTNNPTAFITDNTPTLNEVYTNSYPTFFAPASLDYLVKIKVFSKGGCTSETTKLITVNAMPLITYNNMVGVCINNGNTSITTATVNNGLMGIGKYYGAGTDTLGNFNPIIAGAGLRNIKYVFTASGGCKDSATAQIRVFPKPSAGFAVTNNICLSDSVYIKDTSSIITGGIKDRNWSYGDGTTDIKFNNQPYYKKYSTFDTFMIKLYVVSDSLCVSDTAKQTVIVNPLPVVAFTPPTGVCMPFGEAKFINQSSISAGTVSSLSYVWNFGDNTTSPVINPTHTYTNFGPFNVKLIATSLQGCKDSTTIPLTAFYQQPIANFAIIGDTLCPNKPILFSDLSSAPSSTLSQWNWVFSNGDTANTASVTKLFTTANSYSATLLVKTPDGCTSNPVTQSVTIYKQPVVDAGLIRYTPEGISIPIMATINDTSLFKYLWTPSTYLNNDTLLNPICTPFFSTNYKITATGLGNCIASDTVRVVAFKQLAIPNAFSPNGDNINDSWEIAFLNDYPKCIIEIFNRNGQQMYRSIGYNGPWNGTVNGKPLPVGTYYYIIELNNNGYSKLSGSVTIIR